MRGTPLAVPPRTEARVTGADGFVETGPAAVGAEGSGVDVDPGNEAAADGREVDVAAAAKEVEGDAGG